MSTRAEFGQSLAGGGSCWEAAHHAVEAMARDRRDLRWAGGGAANLDRHPRSPSTGVPDARWSRARRNASAARVRRDLALEDGLVGRDVVLPDPSAVAQRPQNSTDQPQNTDPP